MFHTPPGERSRGGRGTGLGGWISSLVGRSSGGTFNAGARSPQSGETGAREREGGTGSGFLQPISLGNLPRLSNDERRWLRETATNVSERLAELDALLSAGVTGERCTELGIELRAAQAELLGVWTNMEQQMITRGRTEALGQARGVWRQIEAYTTRMVSKVHRFEGVGTLIGGAPPEVAEEVEEERPVVLEPGAAQVSPRAVAQVQPAVRLDIPLTPRRDPLEAAAAAAGLVTPTQEDRREQRRRDLEREAGVGGVLRILDNISIRGGEGNGARRRTERRSEGRNGTPEGAERGARPRDTRGRNTGAAEEERRRLAAQEERRQQAELEERRRQLEQEVRGELENARRELQAEMQEVRRHQEDIRRQLEEERARRQEVEAQMRAATSEAGPTQPRESTPQERGNWNPSDSTIGRDAGNRAQTGGARTGARLHPVRELADGGPRTAGGRSRGGLHPTIARFSAEIPDYGVTEVRNPFTMATRDEDPEWYQANLPFPWDEPPDHTSPLITDYRRLSELCTKFSGEEHNYMPWMQSFIPAIHRAHAPIPYKASCLKKACVDARDPKLRELALGMGTSRDDYAFALQRIAKWYGHPRGLLASRLQALNRTGRVRDDDLGAAEVWYLRMEEYCEAAKKMGRTRDLISTNLYEAHLRKMDKTLRLKYLDWAEWYAPHQDFLSLLAWLGEYVDKLRENSRYENRDEKKEAAMMQWDGGESEDEDRRERRQERRRESSREEREPADGTFRRTDRRSGNCPMCDGKHRLAMCEKYKALEPEYRKNRLDEWKRCYSCLQKGHQIGECNAGVKCAKCPKNHHTLIHEARIRRRRRERVNFANDEGDPDEWSDDSSVAEDLCFRAEETGKTVALQTVPVWVINPERQNKVKMNLMMDPGATGAFMSKEAAEELQAVGRAANTEITGFGGARRKVTVAVVKLQIAGTQRERKKYWVEFQITDNPAARYKPYDWTTEQEKHPHLRNLPLQAPVRGRTVDILLGMSAPQLLASLEPDLGGRNSGEPLARRTRLGWVVGGPTQEDRRGDGAHLAFFTKQEHLLAVPRSNPWETWPLKEKGENGKKDHNVVRQEWGLLQQEGDAREYPKLSKVGEAELVNAVTRMWEIDSSLKARPDSPLDEIIMSKLRDKLKKVDNKYQLPTLWKAGAGRPENNYGFAKKRLKSLVEGKYFKNEQIKSEYLKSMDAWKGEDQVEEVKTDTPDTDEANYLPHFAVVNLAKLSSSVRPVMDGKARGPSGKGLNDYLHKGPKLINELNLVFLRFRHKSITLGADVRKMFYQIRMEERDRDYHRFLWPDKDGTKIYRWKVHPFGSAASPCIAIFTIKEHARRLKEKYPLASETVIKSTLVDDNLDSAHTVEEAKALAVELKELYAEAGMSLGKVVSNSKEVLDCFGEEEKSPSINVAAFCTKDLQLPLVKTLGVVYSGEEDVFAFALSRPDEEVWTKRKVLSFEAQLYDPHGLVIPYVVQSRMLIQEMWRAKLEWDEPLEGALLKRWEKWLDDLSELEKLKIPRCLHPLIGEAPDGEELHIFCDASGDGYAAVAYWVSTKEKKRASRLVVARARVAPLHRLSVPRLELLATQLALDLMELIHQALPISMTQTWFWTDSTNVLCWILAESRAFNSFVGHKVARIQTTTPRERWSWVPTKQNPADIPSRGASMKDLRSESLWWEGPGFLVQDRDQWPPQPDQIRPTKEALQEMKKGDTFVYMAEQPPNKRLGHIRDGYNMERDQFPIRVGCWGKLTRLVGWCLRWRHRKAKSFLDEEDLEGATWRIWRLVQECCLARSREDLVTKGKLSSDSRILSLRPFLDNKGVLRTNARLREALHLPFEARHQVIVPKDHWITELLIRHTHVKLAHAGGQHVLSHLLEKYWLLKARRVIRTVTSECVECRRQRGTPMGQEMATVPDFRVPDRRVVPFAHTALDMAGPFKIKEKNSDTVDKSYFLLLTCMVYRAVHLEPLQDMTADAFLQAYDRFTARRGVPSLVVSDNGSNFIGAQNERRRLWNKFRCNYVQMKRPETTWNFTPPRGPHFGGIYERMIRSVKQAVYHTFTTDNPVPSSVFHTTLVVTEGILNSRPLAYIGADVRDPLPLTPADFLGTAPYRAEPEVPTGEWNLRKVWHVTQDHLDRLWRRWCIEVRPHLQSISTWKKEQRAAKVGDVVAFLDEKRRGRWPMGRVREVIPSHDGKVRRLVVEVAGTVYQRPVHQVALLLPAPETALPPPQ